MHKQYSLKYKHVHTCCSHIMVALFAFITGSFRENGVILEAPNLITNDHFNESESIKTNFSRKITFSRTTINQTNLCYLKGTMCMIFFHLAGKMYFAFKQIVLQNASLFQMLLASTVAIMYQKAMKGCLLIALRVNRFVVSNKQQLDTTNKRMLQYELLTVKNMNYCKK